MNDILMHYGVKHRSGRYPWGSGDNPYQRYGDFYSRYNRLKADGLTEKQIAEQLGVFDKFGNPSVKMLRARYSNAKNEKRAYDVSVAKKYKEDGLNNSEIGRKMGINESTVRSLLDESKAQRTTLTQDTAETLRAYVDDKKYIDIGPGLEHTLGVTRSRLDNAVALLEEDGYKRQFIQIDQMGTDHKTTLTVLTPPDVNYSDLSEHRYDIFFPGQANIHLNANGDVSGLGLRKPELVDPNRIKIVYNEEGGLERDGFMLLRRGAEDLTLGGKSYAQVRIGVEGNRYLKGMAAYGDDLPPGVDIVFFTNKHLGTDKMDVLKKMQTDQNGNVNWDNPFGASVVQKSYIDSNGKERDSACHIVREEGEWQEWSKNLASQFLSKQPVSIAERQLTQDYNDRKLELEEIKSLTNPTLKKYMLLKYADTCDAAAVDLKAAPFAGQQTHVILPFKDIKDGECYAPNYDNGTRLVLVRYPHGGPFECPEVVVNNRKGSDAEKTMGRNAPDAIGINAKAAAKLSGADFDGDTVVAIPLSDKVRLRTAPSLPGLKDYDPKEAYPGYPGMKVMSEQQKQIEMGKVTNLITDMTIKGAPTNDIEKAVRHSMTVIDAVKHELDFKRSEMENDIPELKRRYQDNGDGHTGAGTIISRSSSELDVPVRKDWRAKSTTIGPNGEKIFEETGETYTKAKLAGGGSVTLKSDPDTGRMYYLRTNDISGKKERVYATENDFAEITTGTRKNGTLYMKGTFPGGGEVIVNTDSKTGQRYYLRTNDISGKKERVYLNPGDILSEKTVPRLQKSTKMAETSDAYTLTSGGSKEHPGYKVEAVYAKYANDIKALANAARKEWLETPNLNYDKEAHIKYKEEADSLDRKVKLVEAHAPKERQAQLMANQVMALKKADNPGMTKDEIKKYKGQAIEAARNKVGEKKSDVIFSITDREWEAIQSGAISDTKLRKILNYTDLDKLRERATPRARKTVSPAMESLAKSMKASGYTNSQIADRLGISASSVYNIIK